MKLYVIIRKPHKVGVNIRSSWKKNLSPVWPWHPLTPRRWPCEDWTPGRLRLSVTCSSFPTGAARDARWAARAWHQLFCFPKCLLYYFSAFCSPVMGLLRLRTAKSQDENPSSSSRLIFLLLEQKYVFCFRYRFCSGTVQVINSWHLQTLAGDFG